MFDPLTKHHWGWGWSWISMKFHTWVRVVGAAAALAMGFGLPGMISRIVWYDVYVRQCMMIVLRC
jgi:hypothetical protein